MSSVAAPPLAPVKTNQRSRSEANPPPETDTPPPELSDSVVSKAPKISRNKDPESSTHAHQTHTGTPIFATPPLLDPFLSRKAAVRLTPGLRDMISAMGSCSPESMTPNLTTDPGVLNAARNADLAAFYVPLQASGTPALRDFYGPSHFDTPDACEFDPDRLAEMQSLFSVSASPAELGAMGGMGLGNVTCMSQPFSTNSGNTLDDCKSTGDPTISLLSSPEVGNEIRANNANPSSLQSGASEASGGNSTSAFASPVSDAKSPSPDHMHLGTSEALALSVAVLPTSALSETLTPIVGIGARAAATSLRKRQRVANRSEHSSASRQPPQLHSQTTDPSQNSERFPSNPRASGASPICAAPMQAKAHPLVHVRRGSRSTSARSLPNLIPLPVPVGITPPPMRGGNDRVSQPQKFPHPMVWLNTPHGPTVVPFEFLVTNGMAHHAFTPYGLVPMGPQQKVSAQQARQSKKSTTTPTQAAAGIARPVSAAVLAATLRPGIALSNATLTGEHTAVSPAITDNGGTRKRRRRTGNDDNACSVEQARRNRAKAMVRLKQKKAVRSYEKTVRYGVRKRIAMVRPRVNGRFATKREMEEWERNGGRFCADDK